MDEHLFIVTYDISDPKRWRVYFPRRFAAASLKPPR